MRLFIHIAFVFLYNCCLYIPYQMPCSSIYVIYPVANELPNDQILRPLLKNLRFAASVLGLDHLSMYDSHPLRFFEGKLLYRVSDVLSTPSFSPIMSANQKPVLFFDKANIIYRHPVYVNPPFRYLQTSQLSRFPTGQIFYHISHDCQLFYPKTSLGKGYQT